MIASLTVDATLTQLCMSLGIEVYTSLDGLLRGRARIVVVDDAHPDARRVPRERVRIGIGPAHPDYAAHLPRAAVTAEALSALLALAAQVPSMPADMDTEIGLQDWRDVLHHTLDGIFVADSTGRYRWANPSGLAMLGYTLAELQALSIKDVVAPEDLAQTPLRLPEVSLGRRFYNTRALLRKDGTRIVTEIGALRLPNGYFLGVTRDVSAQLATMEALEQERAFNASVLRTIASLVVVLDREGRILRFNRACEQITGYLEAEVRGQPLWFLLREQERAAVQEQFLALRDDVRLLHHYENDWVSRAGVAKRIAWSNTVITDEDGRVVYIIGTGMDMTERQRIEEELRKVQRLESLGVVAGGIAHDFNNLLMVVLGNLSIVREQLGETSDARRMLEQAERATESAAALTHQLLTFARGGEPQRRQVDLVPMLREVISFCLRGTSIQIMVDLPPEGLWVEGDTAQLHQVFQSLVLNARQAMGGVGGLRVIGRALQQERSPVVRVRISDTGPGVPFDIRERIFDPFFTTQPGGTGLGLAVAHSVIRRHGGNIRLVDSTQGACFELHLPALQGFVVTPSVPVPPSAGPWAVRVLVMDDDPMIQEVLCAMLQRMGATVVVAGDGAEALEVWAASRQRGPVFDLAIVDLTVPGSMGGLEMAERLHATEPGFPMIVSSGYSDDPVLSAPESYGFAAALLKPYRRDAVSVAIRKALGREATPPSH